MYEHLQAPGLTSFSGFLPFAPRPLSADLHVIIFDEIDAICKARGSVRDGSGVHDTIVNQLLTKIDGVDALNNILLIGMTNRWIAESVHTVLQCRKARTGQRRSEQAAAMQHAPFPCPTCLASEFLQQGAPHTVACTAPRICSPQLDEISSVTHDALSSRPSPHRRFALLPRPQARHA